MGGKKETEKPYYSQYYKEVKGFIEKPDVELSPFLQQIQGWGEKQIGKTQEFIQSMQNRALEGLKFALSNAVGQASITPYENIYSQKASEMLQKRAEPIQNVAQDIASQYQPTASNLGGALKLAGAYSVLPTPQEVYERKIETLQPSLPDETGYVPPDFSSLIAPKPSKQEQSQYKELLPSYQNAYNTSINFMKQTIDLLKQLNFTDDEIKTTINPFISQFKLGAYDVEKRFGFTKAPPETTTERWLKEIGL